MEIIVTYSGIVAAGLAVMVLLLVVLQFSRLNKLRSLIDSEKQTNSKQFERIQKQQKQQEEFLNELKMATRGISDKVISLQNREVPDSVSPEELLELKEQMVELNAKLHAMESADPASKLYTKASKLVAGGATIEDIMQECDLPRAEAELMMSLHSSD